MAKMFREAAKLRNNIEGCVRAAPAPMNQYEVFEWPSVKEVVGPRGFKRVEYALLCLAREGRLIRERLGHMVYVRPVPIEDLPPSVVTTTVPSVDVNVDKINGAVTVKCKGIEVRITITGD